MLTVSSQMKGIAAIAFASALFGTTGLFVNHLQGMTFTTIFAYRLIFGLLAFAVLALVSSWWREALRPRRKDLRFYAALGLALVTIDLGYYFSILTVGMGLATILLATAPAFVVLANWAIWREHPTKATLGGMALGFVGVAAIVGMEGLRARPLGIVAGLMSGAAYAAWLLTTRTAEQGGARGESLAAGSVALMALVLAPTFLALSPQRPDGVDGWLAAAGLGVVVGVVAFVLFSRGVQSVKATHASVLAYLEPVTAFAVGVLLLHESYTLLQFAGGFLVLVGMTIVSHSRSGDGPAETRNDQMGDRDLPARQDS